MNKFFPILYHDLVSSSDLSYTDLSYTDLCDDDLCYIFSYIKQ